MSVRIAHADTLKADQSDTTHSEYKCAYFPSWLEGTWISTKDSGTTTETWNVITTEVISGVARTRGIDGKVSFSESLLIAKLQGKVFYIAKTPDNVFPVSFMAQRCSENRFEVNNPQHDFPDTITYQLQQDGSLRVVISGKEKATLTIHYNRN